MKIVLSCITLAMVALAKPAEAALVEVRVSGKFNIDGWYEPVPIGTPYSASFVYDTLSIPDRRNEFGRAKYSLKYSYLKIGDVEYAVDGFGFITYGSFNSVQFRLDRKDDSLLGFTLGYYGFSPGLISDALPDASFYWFPGSVGYTSPINTAGIYGTATASARLLSGVPEPATWAMMLGGFGLIGLVSRRRNRTLCF